MRVRRPHLCKELVVLRESVADVRAYGETDCLWIQFLREGRPTDATRMFFTSMCCDQTGIFFRGIRDTVSALRGRSRITHPLNLSCPERYFQPLSWCQHLEESDCSWESINELGHSAPNLLITNGAGSPGTIFESLVNAPSYLRIFSSVGMVGECQL